HAGGAGGWTWGRVTCLALRLTLELAGTFTLSLAAGLALTFAGGLAFALRLGLALAFGLGDGVCGADPHGDAEGCNRRGELQGFTPADAGLFWGLFAFFRHRPPPAAVRCSTRASR